MGEDNAIIRNQPGVPADLLRLSHWAKTSGPTARRMVRLSRDEDVLGIFVATRSSISLERPVFIDVEETGGTVRLKT